LFVGASILMGLCVVLVALQVGNAGAVSHLIGFLGF